MKTKYTQQDINRFFEEFKNLPDSLGMEKVHQLVNNPNAKATHKVKLNYLKLIFMTSALIIGASALILWFSPGKPMNSNLPVAKHSVAVEKSGQMTGNEVNNKISNTNSLQKQSKTKDAVHQTFSKTQPVISDKDGLIAGITIISTVSKDSSQNKTCTWPSDTVLDKKSLYVYLSDSELDKLGVILKKNSMYYENKTPDGKNGTGNRYNWKGKTGRVTHHEFYMAYDSDTACTKYRWGHPFYTKIDTLVPVVITLNNETKILWFTPHASFFEALPARYAYLKNVYDNLKSVKKQNPKHQFVNYWNKDRNIILDKINFLTVSKETLKNIGFEIFKDSISIVHPDYNMQFNMGKWKSLIGTNTKKPPYPPNPLPVIVTDEKGLLQNYFGQGSSPDFNKSMFDILVPVKIPLNELISTKDYYLIFWYYPTDKFIDALPGEIKNELKAERNDIINGTTKSAGPCTYFEACKSTLELDDLEVFPNPANQNITIRFSMSQGTNGKISLINVSGALVKTIIPERSFDAGLNSFDVNLSDISPGVYLISIATSKGFKTKRIIVTH